MTLGGKFAREEEIGPCMNTWAKSMKQKVLFPMELDIALHAEGNGQQGRVQSPTPQQRPHLHITDFIHQKHAM